MIDIYFIRHGESQANADGVIAGSLDSPLTERGIRQARDAAKVILAGGIRFDVIISSSLSRAHNTASIIAKAVEYPLNEIVVIDELQEKGAGGFEGGAIGALYAANDEEMRQAGAESFVNFAERVTRANALIKKRAIGTTLVVGHAGVYRMAQTLRQGLHPDEMKNMKKVPNGKLMEYPLREDIKIE